MTTCPKCSHLDDSHSPECPIGGDVKVAESKAVAEAATPVKSSLHDHELPKTLHRKGAEIWDDKGFYFGSTIQPSEDQELCGVFAGEVVRRWNRHEGLVEENSELKKFVQAIHDMTNADDYKSYRSDDREGCLDTCFGMAKALLTKLNNQGEV